MMISLAVGFSTTNISQAMQLAKALKLPLIPIEHNQNFDAILAYDPMQRLTLQLSAHSHWTPLVVDFLQGKVAYRCKAGGGRHQQLARAVGLHKSRAITICDVTAGLGQDAYVLAYLGATVTMIERNPAINALLADGLQRLQQALQHKTPALNLVQDDALHYLLNLEPSARPQVIYMDPMFPEDKRTALAKKEMRILRYVVGADEDAEEVLELALQIATQRVVVKRPRLAPAITGATPSFNLIGQSNRFDIYLV